MGPELFASSFKLFTGYNHNKIYSYSYSYIVILTSLIRPHLSIYVYPNFEQVSTLWSNDIRLIS